MTDIPEKMNMVVCGRLIGRATTHDEPGTWIMDIYDLEPAPEYKGPVADCISICFEYGTIETWDDDGKLIQSCDLIDAISGCAVERIG